MNAIIALCHFCDNHGPQTLFCTQAFKYSDLHKHQAKSINTTSLVNSSDENNGHTHYKIENSQVLDPAPPDSSFSPSGQQEARPDTLINSEQQRVLASQFFSSSPSSLTSSHSLSPKASHTNPDSSGSSATCKACRAFDKTFNYYISYDEECEDSVTDNFNSTTTRVGNSVNNTVGSNSAKICYLSQPTPSDPEVFALVRKACLRTLHGEVFEDPIYFDDDNNGSVIGYEFNIKDSEGRGFQRSYSLLIIMKDRIYLQHLWSFLSKQMSIIASNIKQEAEKKFVKDMRNKDITVHKPYSLLAQPENPSQSVKITNTEPTRVPTLTHSSSFHSTGVINASSSYSRQTMYTTKKSMTSKQRNATLRGLIELTDDPMIYAKLHMWFTWILRMSSCQITEEFVHGPLSEDWQVKLERDQIKKQFDLKSKETIREKNDYNDDDDQLNVTRLSYEDTQFDMEKRPSSSDQILKSSAPLEALSTTNDSLVAQFEVQTLRDLIKLLGMDVFHQVAYHVIVGNQVIFRGKNQRLISSIIKVLETLIPLGCCKSIHFSDEYVKSYECKLLGISEKALPLFYKDNVDLLYKAGATINTSHHAYLYPDLNEHILVDVAIWPYMNAECFLNEDTSLDETNSFDAQLARIKENNNLTVYVKSNVEEITANPTILKKIEGHLLNDKLDMKSVECLIKQLKEEWINKTKVFYKFMQSPSVKNKVDIEVVLRMLNLSKDDELAIKYWQGGLSSECKAQIRSS